MSNGTELTKGPQWFRVSEPAQVELPDPLWRVLRYFAHRRIVVCRLVVAAVVAGTLVILLGHPVYEATATIALNSDPVSGREDKSAGRTRPEQLARPQMVLLSSEGVIRKAIGAVGVDRLYPKIAARAERAQDRPQLGSLGQRIRLLLEPVAPQDAAFLAASKAIDIRAESQTELIRIAFQHPDPAVAMDFTNAWLQAFTERYFQIYSNSGAVAALWELQKRSNESFEQASAALAKYSAESQIFQVVDQRRLLLERRNEVAGAISLTRGMIAEKQAQADAIPQQLAQMKPIGRLSQVIGLTKDAMDDTVAGRRAPPSVASPPQDTPLLLVRVYQETIASLVRLQTEIAGQRTLITQQQQTLGQIDTELNDLSRREAEFERLRLAVSQGRLNAELYMKRANEEEFHQEMNARKLSSVQVVQAPTSPFRPVWPKPFVTVMLALLACAAAFGLSRWLAEYDVEAAPYRDDEAPADIAIPQPLLGGKIRAAE